MPPPLDRAAAHGISYRLAGEGDMAFMAALYASTRAKEVGRTGWPAEVQQAFLAQQFDAQHKHYLAHYPSAERLVVERGGRPIGRLYLDRRAETFDIVDISLIPSARGFGIGGAILDDIAEEARKLGRKVSIHVEKTNPAARLYRRVGFETVADKGVYEQMELKPGGKVS